MSVWTDLATRVAVEVITAVIDEMGKSDKKK